MIINTHAMKIILSLILAAMPYLVCCASSSGRNDAEWKEMGGVTVPVPPAEHPRLYVRASDIPDVRARMESDEGKAILAKLKKAGIDRTPEEEASEKDRGFRYYFKMRGLTSRVQLLALDYLTDRDTAKAREAITSMLDTLKRTDFGTGKDLSRASGVMLMVGAMVYDWCYDQLTEAEKQAYITEFIRIAGTMECHYPPKRTEPIAGHSSEWMILRDMLSCGIAIYDEYPDMYNYVIKMMFEDYIPVRNFIYRGENYHQGTGYVTVRFSNDLISLWILDRMGAGPVYDPAQQYVLYDFIYRRRPDGQVLPAGDVNPGNRKSINSYALPAMLAYSYYKDPYLAYEFDRKPDLEPHCLMFELLWRDFGLERKSPDDLPLTRYSGTPFGWMIARTGWDANSVIAEMKVNEHFVGNHQHLDAGSFQIYYKGPLAIDSGSYQGSSGGYNSPHNKNYFKRTIAHNSLLVYDPDEKFACWNYGGGDKTEFAANDGGQRMPGDRWDTCRSFEDLLSESYTVGKALAHDFGPDVNVPDYSYLKGDMTKAYSSKVKDVRRSFVFLNLKGSGSGDVPAALIVYDHVVSSDPSFRKYWLLHSIEEPVIDGNTFTVRRTTMGDSGMLMNTVLLPETPGIEKVGGPGKEFWVFGTNYPNAATTRPDPANERGAWRVEVTPREESVEDCFLNVMQVADGGTSDMNRVQRIDADRVTGAVVADRIVLFSRDGRPLDGEFTFTTPAAPRKDTFRILVTDLEPGVWTVYKKNSAVAELESCEGAGTVYFDGTAGTYTLRRKISE